MREEMAANHQTISITVSGLAELAHSEYQVGRICEKKIVGFFFG